MKENLSTKECSKLAWSTVCFVKLWKAWLEKSHYQVASSFISLQTYNDMIIARHSFILSMNLFVAFFPFSLSTQQRLVPTAAKYLFAQCRGFCNEKTNLCMLDLLDNDVLRPVPGCSKDG